MQTLPTIHSLLTTAYKKRITFSKNTAMKFIGSRAKLEQLVAEGKIRMHQNSNAQNSRWQLNAGDVLFHSK